MDNNNEQRQQQYNNSDWAELTLECLINILSRLTLEDRWRSVMLVCKPWLRACKDSALHPALDLEPWFNSALESARWWDPEFERRVDSMLKSVSDWRNEDGGVTVIRVRHCSDNALIHAADRCPDLEILSIKSSPHVTDTSMTRVAFRCMQIRELDISYCYEISHESLVLIGRNCPNLKILKRNFMNWLDPSQYAGVVPSEYLDACPQDADTEAAAIGKYMPHLEHLEIRFSKLSAKGFVSICEGCLNLEYIDIFGCAGLTSRDIANSSSNLTKLKEINKPNFYFPRSVFQTDRYGHWRLYDERFQTDVFRI